MVKGEVDTNMSIEYDERITFILQQLEDMGYHMYYDEKLMIWECMSEEHEFSVSGWDKYQVIQIAFSRLMT